MLKSHSEPLVNQIIAFAVQEEAEVGRWYTYTFIIQEMLLSLLETWPKHKQSLFIVYAGAETSSSSLSLSTLYSVSRLGALQHPRQTALVYALRGEQRDER